jgi:inorganic pyrophosphatase
MYGFPQDFSGNRVAEFCMEKKRRKDIMGDGDPVDVCVLTEK